MSVIKTALVGFGLGGRYFHAPFLATQPENYDVTTVLERTKQDSKAIFPNARIVQSMENLLKDKTIELVIITTPNQTHFSLAKAALLAGKHVVVDKPLTAKSTEAMELMEIAKSQNQILSVYQNRRYDNDFLTVQEILQKKLLGDISEYEAQFDRYSPNEKPNAWREKNEPGSGTLYDLGPHLLDQALVLFGLPQMIEADVRKERPHAKVPDYFDIKLTYPNILVRLKSSMLVNKLGPRYFIRGSHGTYTKYGIDSQEHFLRQNRFPNELHWGLESPDQYGTIQIGNEFQKYKSQNGNYGSYYQNLFQSIRNHKPIREKAEHGYNTVRLIELAMKSSLEKTPVPCNDLLNIEYP